MTVDDLVESAAPPDFVKLYRVEHNAMVRLARLFVGSVAVAEELVHDAFISVYQRLDQLDQPGAYLRQIVVNNCRGWLRRASVGDRKVSFLAAQAPDDAHVTLDPEYDEIWQALKELNETQRTALVLRFYLDLKVTEIAEAMGVRPGTVKSAVHRGLATLRRELEA